MQKMWAGRTSAATDKIADDFNSSIAVDSRMYRQDITGSMAHAAMLAACSIVSQEDADTMIEALEGILNDLDSGKLAVDENAEDIHMFVEQVLTERIGDVGKRLHTARSRNDQVALDVRMYLRDETGNWQLELTWLRDHADTPYELGENESHLGLVTDDYEAAHALHEKMGCICFENPAMGIYFVEDPDGYWVEVVPPRR